MISQQINQKYTYIAGKTRAHQIRLPFQTSQAHLAFVEGRQLALIGMTLAKQREAHSDSSIHSRLLNINKT